MFCNEMELSYNAICICLDCGSVQYTFYPVQYIEINVFSIFVGTMLQGGEEARGALDFRSRKVGKHEKFVLKSSIWAQASYGWCIFELDS